jgi:hypothetical protein
MATTVDELAEVRRYQRPRVVTCSIGRLLEELPERQSHLLGLACADPSILGVTIEAWLAKECGVSRDSQTIQRHRKGVCRCGRA